MFYHVPHTYNVGIWLLRRGDEIWVIAMSCIGELIKSEEIMSTWGERERERALISTLSPSTIEELLQAPNFHGSGRELKPAPHSYSRSPLSS